MHWTKSKYKEDTIGYQMQNVEVRTTSDFQNSSNDEDIFLYHNVMGRLLGWMTFKKLALTAVVKMESASTF